jgi:hypothetical protein
MHDLERPPSIQRFVLCRPRGGLNDTLCQIEKCWRYAEFHDRRLVIDTRRSSLFGEFSDFFMPKSGNEEYFTLRSFDLARLNQLDCMPAALRGRLESYTAAFKGHGKYIDTESSAGLTFDFARSWNESVLVHEQCGGGQLSFDLLRRVTLSPAAREFVVSATDHLAPGYAAVHVRNTDYKTSYKGLLGSIAPNLSGRSILICSDDPEVFVAARSIFKNSEVLTVDSPLALGGKPLHRYRSHVSNDQRSAAAYSSIADLVALGKATDLYFTDVTKGYPSGFSRLAEFLCNNQDVIADLMGEPHPTGVAVRVQGRSHHWRPPGVRVKDRLDGFTARVRKHAIALVRRN